MQFGLTRLDGRTKESAFLREVRSELLEHWPNPTITQRLLIDRAAILCLRLAQIDARVIAIRN